MRFRILESPRRPEYVAGLPQAKHITAKPANSSILYMFWIALQLIIIVTFAWDILRWLDFIITGQINADWIEIFTEVCDALFGISLAIGYCYESAPFLLPYLFVQLFTLVISMILFAVCVLTIMWPENPWASSFYTQFPPKSSTTRLKALIYSIFPLIFTLLLIWVIRVLLACYVYFNDQKKTLTGVPAVSVQTNGPSANVIIIPPSGPENGTTTVLATSAPTIPEAPSTFSNPNFTLDDEEDGEDQLWPQKTSNSASNPS